MHNTVSYSYHCVHSCFHRIIKLLTTTKSVSPTLDVLQAMYTAIPC